MRRRAAKLADDELRRMVFRVLAAMVVDAMVGKLGVDFIEALSFLVLQCCRYEEAELPDAASSERVALLCAENQAELRVVPLDIGGF